MSVVLSGRTYDVIVVGAGHAGCEAALAAARMGCRTAVFTTNLDSIALMPCNPAIGGIAKGHLVREIDALGGEMAHCIDRTGIQFRVLNRSKGPAVRGYRAQADKLAYRLEMKARLEAQERLDVKQALIESLLVEDRRVHGVITQMGETYEARAVVVSTGTFLGGMIHVGLRQFPAGRAGEFPADGLSRDYADHGFPLGRLKTGTCPRLDARTIDFDSLEVQPGDDPPLPFSFDTGAITQSQLPCHLTYTNDRTHEVIRQNLDRSPLYSGLIVVSDPAIARRLKTRSSAFPTRRGTRFSSNRRAATRSKSTRTASRPVCRKRCRWPWCVRFPDWKRPKSCALAMPWNTTSCRPPNCIPGWKPSDWPVSTMPAKSTVTTGYEEAAAQGLVAGINAALQVQRRSPLVIKRTEGYVGVMIDDLVTLGTSEPYRMFTSRSEYRLILRQDNADLRLRDEGHELGLVAEETYRRFCDKRQSIEAEIGRLAASRISPDAGVNDLLMERGTDALSQAAFASELLKRPQLNYADVVHLMGETSGLAPDVIEQVEIRTKYEGYIRRQLEQVARVAQYEGMPLPTDFDYRQVPGLSLEIQEKLLHIRPTSLAQAGRISGVTPAAVAILMVYFQKHGSPHAQHRPSPQEAPA